MEYKMINFKDLLTVNLKEELQRNKDKVSSKTPKQHQTDAIKKMNDFFLQEDKRAGILVMPTGAGKTYTAVYWLLKNIISKNKKVLWLADQGFLLEQARESFRENILEVDCNRRNEINIRIVSGSYKHDNTNRIAVADDILLMTSQTAISCWTDPNDIYFRKFINENAKEGNLFIVYDEAHHTPAFGRRNLLIGGSEGKIGIIEKFPQTQLLGLTATPTYTDKKQRGWLWEIFKDGIIFEISKKELEDEKILAIPLFIQENTNFNFVLSDNDVEKLIFKHQELPSYVIEEIAKNEPRNNFIAQYYCDNRETFGKTIIFLDRWIQCKMVENYINKKAGKVIAQSVFSYIDGNKNNDYINNRKFNQNEINLDRFRKGEIDILINVKMLTEGVDVPDVKTVFLTRDTNSTILFTQMIGRALRGKEAGGNKTTANIVLFSDNWNRHIQFASNRFLGGKENTTTKERGYRPFELISIDLLDKLELEYQNQDYEKSIMDLVPDGWYVVEYSDTIVEENENNETEKTTERFYENVVVTNLEKLIFEKFIQEFPAFYKNSIWENEELELDKAESIINDFLTKNNQINNKATTSKLIQIGRHLGQSIETTPPDYYTFDQKNEVDLMKNVEIVFEKDMRKSEEQKYLESIFYDNVNPFFKSIFPTFESFQKSYNYHCLLFEKRKKNNIEILEANQNLKTTRLGSDEVRKMVLSRDENTCQCCGKKNDLKLDHIISFKHEAPDNDDPSFFQTLCSICNNEKSANNYDYRENKYHYNPNNFGIENVNTSKSNLENPIFYFTRLINCYFKTSAVHFDSVKASNHGRSIWMAEVKYGVDVNKTILKHKEEIINIIKSKGYSFKDIRITIS